MPDRPGHPRLPFPIWERYANVMLTIEIERETDGRWLAEVPALPGAMTFGDTDHQARAKVTALALRIAAERIENREASPQELAGMFAKA